LEQRCPLALFAWHWFPSHHLLPAHESKIVEQSRHLNNTSSMKVSAPSLRVMPKTFDLHVPTKHWIFLEQRCPLALFAWHWFPSHHLLPAHGSKIFSQSRHLKNTSSMKVSASSLRVMPKTFESQILLKHCSSLVHVSRYDLGRACGFHRNKGLGTVLIFSARTKSAGGADKSGAVERVGAHLFTVA